MAVQFDASGLQPFTFDVTAQQYTSGPAVQEARLGVNGGHSVGRGISAAEFATPGQGPSSALPDFFNAVFADQIQEKKQETFYKGFADARAGKTIAEINRDTPWFASLFGQTNYEAGASVYNAQAAVATTTQQMHENMDELKTKTPEEMGQWLAEKQKSMQTGDDFADVAMNKALLENSGPMLDAQAKANFAWKQDNLVKAQGDNAMAQSRLFEVSTRQAWEWGQKHPNEAPNEYDQQERERNMLDAFGIQKGQTMESAVKFFTQYAADAGREGLWHSIDLMKNTGLYQQLPSEAQEKVEKSIATANARWMQNMESTDATTPAYMIRAKAHGGLLAPDKTLESVRAFNAQWKASTGSTIPYFTNSETEALVSGSAEKTIAAEQARLDRLNRLQAAHIVANGNAEAKEAADAQMSAEYAKSVAQGSIGALSMMPKFDKVRADATFATMLQANPDRALDNMRLNFVSNIKSYVADPLAQQFQDMAGAGAGLEPNDATDRAHAMWQKMYSSKGADPTRNDGMGPSFAKAYFGPKINDAMLKYERLQSSGVTRADAYKKAFGDPAVFEAGDIRGGAGFNANTKLLQQAIKSGEPTWWNSKGVAIPATDSSINVIAHYASQEFSDIIAKQPELSPEQAAAIAVRNVKEGDVVDRIGGWYFKNPQGSKALADTLAWPRDKFDDEATELVKKRFKAQGLKVDRDTGISINRLSGNGIQLSILGHNKDGTEGQIMLTDDDFKSFRDEYEKRQKDIEAHRDMRTPNDMLGGY